MDSKNSNDTFFNNIQEKDGIKYYIIGPGATFYRADNPTSNNIVFNTREDNLDERTFDSPPSSPVKTTGTLPIFPYLFFSPSYDSVQANYGKKTIFEIQNKQNLKLIALDQDQPELFKLLKDEKPNLDDNEINNNIMNEKKIDSNKSIIELLVQHFAYNSDGTKDFENCRHSVLEVDKFMAIYFSNGKFKEYDGYGCNFLECLNKKDDHFHSEFTIKDTRNKIIVEGIVDENRLRATSVKKQQYKPPPSSRKKRPNNPPTPNNLSFSSLKKGTRPSIFSLDNEFDSFNINTPNKKRNTLFSPTKQGNDLNSLAFDSLSPVVSPVHGGKNKKPHKNKRKTKKSRKSNRKSNRKTKRKTKKRLR